MTPPRLAVLLLTRLLPVEVHEGLLGDLEEEYRTRVLPARGRRGAHRWFWRQTLAALPLARLTRPRHTIPTRTGDGIMLAFASELRLAARRLARAPGFVAVAALTLALGIGATTAILSVVNPVLFESLPYPEADRIVAIGENDEDGDLGRTGFATFADLRRDSRGLEAVTAMSYWMPVIGGESEPERVIGQSVTHEFFRVLGVRPMLGRGFLAEEDAPDRNRAVVLSHGLWTRRYGADSSLVGRQVLVGGMPHTVVGVMPRSFESLILPQAVIWRPLGYDASLSQACRTCRHLSIAGRLHPGISPADLDRELDVLSARMVQDHPTEYAAAGIRVVGLQKLLVQPVRAALLLLLGAVGIVLVMACTNVANLTLGRSIQREAEFGIRAALGAGRLHVFRQLFAESLLLAALGGAGGLGLAWLGVKVLVALGPDSIPRLAAVRVDGEIIVVAAMLVLGTALVTGLAPALMLRRADVYAAMRQGAAAVTSSRRRTRVRGGLVVAEMALALTLMAGAGLLVKSVQRLLRVDPGFEADGLLTLAIQTSGPAYAEEAPVRAVQQRVLEAVRALPGVKGAGLASQIPLGGNFDGYGVLARDKPLANPEDAPGAQRYAVSHEFLGTLGITLRAGRTFQPSDATDAPPVVLVNEALARALWPGEDPIGKEIRIGGPTRPWRRVVGVTANTRHLSLDAEEPAQFLLPLAQWFFADNPVILVVRAGGEPQALIRTVREAVWSVDKSLAISDVATMTERLAGSASQRRFAMLVFQAFAVVAIVMAGAGLYGVLAGSVAERSRELGIRSALGATRRRLLTLVLSDGLRFALLGVLVGTGGALALSQFIRGLLFGVSSHDPVTLVSVAMALLLVATAACLVPAWRAARADPVTTLKGG
jgi:putative ABC transport system permease protein